MRMRHRMERAIASATVGAVAMMVVGCAEQIVEPLAKRSPAALAPSVALPALVNGAVVVRPADVAVGNPPQPGKTWYTADTRSEGSSALAAGLGTPPLGTGSLQMSTNCVTSAPGCGQAKAQLFTFEYAGTPLAGISALSFKAYRSSASTNSLAQTLGLNLQVDFLGNGASFTTLVYEPVYQPGGVGALQLDTWQNWDAIAGGNAIWWSTQPIPGVCAFTCYVPWSAILAANPNAKILAGVGFNIGSGWTGKFDGAADQLVIAVPGYTTTYDFEPAPTPPVVTNVAASPNPVAIGATVTLTADASDAATGGSNITGAQYSIDGGAWVAMTATDLAFDESAESVRATFAAPATPAIYDVCVRATDATGSTSSDVCTSLVVYDPNAGFVTGGGWIESPPGSAATLQLTTVWNQGFEGDAAGWSDAASSWYGSVTRVASGTNGITSLSGGSHAEMTGDASSAPFSRFDMYRSTWLGAWNAEVAVYLDPAWPSGAGFDYSVASSSSTGTHRRDFIFHVTKDISSGALLVGASNNTNFAPRQDLETIPHYTVTAAGWYTLRHRFRDQGGVLAVDLQLLDVNGTVLFTETRSDASDLIPSVVGGNRYAWFTVISGVTLAVDDHRLSFPVLVDPVGRANFAFVSKYVKGKALPTGQTEFVFNAANLNFHSGSYEWLIVNQAGANAQFKGRGTINGGGDYTFMLWATDGDKDSNASTVDSFRIKIWDTSSGNVVYDNAAEVNIAGGSIMIHVPKK